MCSSMAAGRNWGLVESGLGKTEAVGAAAGSFEERDALGRVKLGRGSTDWTRQRTANPRRSARAGCTSARLMMLP